MQLKICFIAPSEYGKNTAVKLLKEKYPIKNVKIAAPIYELVDRFYKYIETEMKGEQDGEFMQYLGRKIRQENVNFLHDCFIKEYNNSKNFCGIITNDDCRPPDYQFMKNLGFTFVKIVGFRRDRLDHTKSDPQNNLEWQENYDYDYCVENLKSIEEYRKNLYALVEKLLNYKG